MTSTATKVHNLVAPEIVKQIIKAPVETGGTPAECMVILESVIVGVLLVVAKPGDDAAILDTMIEGAKRRIAEIRLEMAVEKTTHG